MKIYNTASRKIEEFKPLKQDKVKVYYCGPTVYNYAHIWNLRTFTFEDIMVKTLRFLGYNVETTMNITDVDDKTIRDSRESWEDLKTFTEKYTKIFLEDLEKLWIQKADNIVPVTSLINQMVRMINTMLRRAYAYLAEDGSIYYRVSKCKKYWKFAHIDLSWLKQNARINNDEYDKDNFWDFVLWKAWKPEDWENFWEEEFSLVKSWKLKVESNDIVKKVDENDKEIKVKIKWRPGWHIECSACNMAVFGPQIDLHMGGQDLIFPHHQNEIAQTEACTRKTFSKYWMHSAHLMVNGKKMSKSLGNFYTLRDLEEHFKDVNKSVLYRAIRLSFINGKYRETIDFSFDKLKSSINTIKKIDETIKKIARAQDEAKEDKVRKEFSEKMQEVIWEYINALEDDLNTPEALAVFHNFLKFVNSWISNNEFSFEEYNSIFDMLETINYVLWIIDFWVLEEWEIPQNILEKFEARNKAKKEKNFELADKLRDELFEAWYKIIDSREGSKIEKV